MLDCSGMTYGQMSDVITDIAREVKRRNPLFCNIYVDLVVTAAQGLAEVQRSKDAIPDQDMEESEC